MTGAALARAILERAIDARVDPGWLAELAAAGVDRRAVIGEVVRATGRRLGADRATLFRVEPSGGAISEVADLPELGAIRLAPGEGVAGWVARTGEIVRAGRGDARFSARIDALTGYRTRTLLAVPVGAGAGVLQLLNRAGGPFTASDEALACAVAAQLAALGDTDGGGLGETSSPAMQAAVDRIRRAAPVDATVLLRGESGTGKELAARAIHAGSPRRGGPFVVVDCAALPAALLENELFGHARGAFTGADRDEPGRVHAAAGGTLFLDEIGELPLAVQGKLLRLLQERTFFRVGGQRAEVADVRFVAATWRDLEAEVAAGRFRRDLYWRLRVVEVHLPPLRERGPRDVERLARGFLARYAAQYGRPALLRDDAWAALLAHRWPGNVRELQHCLEAAVALSDGEPIGPAQLLGSPAPDRASTAAGTVPAGGETGGETLAERESAWIASVLAACGGNRTEAARRLGIGRSTLLRRLRGAPGGHAPE